MENYYKLIIILSLAFVVIHLIWQGYLKDFLPDLKRDLILYGLQRLFPFLILCLLLVLFIDQPVRYGVRLLHFPGSQVLMYYANELGNGYYLFPFLLLLYLFSFLFTIPQMRQVVAVMILGSLLSGLCGEIVKALTLRSRPYLDFGAYHFFNFISAFQGHHFFSGAVKSFPSGHTINAFGFITPLVLLFNKRWYAYFLFFLPVLTGLARIYYDKHWFSDVVFGAFMTIYISSLIYRNIMGQKEKLEN